MNEGTLLSKWLVHSYLYYELHESCISDFEFDMLGRELKSNWDHPEIVNHVHRHLIQIDNGVPVTFSGHYITEYPGIVKGCALGLLKAHHENNRLTVTSLFGCSGA